MNTRKTLLSLATVVIAAASFGTSAQVVNPDNDSGTFFGYKKASATVTRVAGVLPSTGQTSLDGRYVWSGGERGWVHREHSYALDAGKLVHTADCVPYNMKAPLAAFASPAMQAPFADHGA